MIKLIANCTNITCLCLIFYGFPFMMICSYITDLLNNNYDVMANSESCKIKIYFGMYITVSFKGYWFVYNSLVSSALLLLVNPIKRRREFGFILCRILFVCNHFMFPHFLSDDFIIRDETKLLQNISVIELISFIIYVWPS